MVLLSVSRAVVEGPKAFHNRASGYRFQASGFVWDSHPTADAYLPLMWSVSGCGRREREEDPIHVRSLPRPPALRPAGLAPHLLSLSPPARAHQGQAVWRSL